jgi:xanthine dehydrogenase large subunit
LKPLAAEILSADIASIDLINEHVWINGQQTELTWFQLIQQAYVKRISLSEHSHYATPGLNFDQTKEKGHPFAYHVFGTAITVVTVDCLRGIYEFDAVKIVHDFGSSMNELIDRGQIEGGLVQGMGWMTMEEIV